MIATKLTRSARGYCWVPPCVLAELYRLASGEDKVAGSAWRLLLYVAKTVCTRRFWLTLYCARRVDPRNLSQH